MNEEEWSLLQQTVDRVVHEGRLGAPRFVRCTVQASSGGEPTKAVLEAMVKMAERLFQDRAQSLRTLGSDESGHLVTAARWPGGQGALLAAGPAGPGPSPIIDLIVLGSRGALYYATPARLLGGSRQ